MNRCFSILALTIAACAVVRAATSNTTITVTNAAGSLGASGLSATGPVTLSGIGSGTFTGSLPLTPDSSQNLNGTFTINVTSGTTGTITGTLKVPATALVGGALTGTVTVTGGTGNFAGATGTFSNATGSLNLLASTFSLTATGTITTSGGGGPSTPTPTITAVQDAASNTPNIAQGSIFIVKGSNLSASGFTSFAPPRPTQSTDGVKVTFTPVGGGAGTDAFLVYLYNQSGVNQIACILPSTVAVGNYNVTVTSGGTTSASFPASVVANKLALFTQDSTGGGLASVQNFISQGVVDLNRLTTGSVGGVTISPAKPGQPVIAYGTGLGGYAAGDNTASPLFDFRGSLTIQAVVGGMTIPVDYAGRAGYAGEDQINFTLPANVPTGCAVNLQISVNGKLSPAVTIAIAPTPSATACVLPGYTTQQLQSLDQGGSIVTGGFAISQFGISLPQIGSVKSNSIGGGFIQLTAFNIAAAGQVNASVIQAGSCQVFQAQSTGNTPNPNANLTYLDAGTVTITGPSGSGLSNQVLTKTNNSYGIISTEGFSIPGQLNFTLPAGGYQLNGGGGPDVGTFGSNITLSAPITVTGGLPSNVNRSSPLTLNWTGGAASDLVQIIGSSSTSTGSGASTVTTSTTFICTTTAGAGTFTVASSILSQLPASTANSPGILEIASGNAPATFSASLPKLGGSANGAFLSFVGSGAQVTWQ